MDLEHVVGFVVALLVMSSVFRMIKHRGWKGALFGAPVGRQIAAIELERHGLGVVKQTLKIHLLEPRTTEAGPHVGLEILDTGLGWGVKPVALTREEARMLAQKLTAAADASATVARY